MSVQVGAIGKGARSTGTLDHDSVWCSECRWLDAEHMVKPVKNEGGAATKAVTGTAALVNPRLGSP